MLKYYVREPLSAVRSEPRMPAEFVTIESGSVITVKGHGRPFGFVDVHYREQIVKVFMLDIEKHADRVAGMAG